MSDSNSNGKYETRNTALAAYLRIEGFRLLDVIPARQRIPAVFYFEHHPNIINREKDWQLKNATGNLADFFDSYRLCLMMVKVGRL